MISAHAYDELMKEVRETVGEDAYKYIFPAVEKALEEGDGKVRENILFGWLDIDSMRVCSTCGAIMEEGWYLDSAGYACSDECAAKSEGITMEQFKKWRIYKDDIVRYLQLEGIEKDINELTQEECDAIIDEFADNCDYCWTEWY